MRDGRTGMFTSRIEAASSPLGGATRENLVVIIANSSEQRQQLAGALPGGATVLLANDIVQARQVMAQLPGAAPQRRRHSAARPVPTRAADQPEPPLQLDKDRLSLLLGEREVTLTPLEFALLTYFFTCIGELATYQKLSEVAWETDYLGDGAHMHAAVARLRSKLAELGAPLTLHAVRGRGFRLARHAWAPSSVEAVAN